MIIDDYREEDGRCFLLSVTFEDNLCIDTRNCILIGKRNFLLYLSHMKRTGGHYETIHNNYIP